MPKFNAHTVIKKYKTKQKLQKKHQRSLITNHHNVYDYDEKFRLLWELLKCDTETWSEQTLLEKWHQ